MGEAAAEIEATGIVPAPPDEVFDFLSDLANHWRLVDRFVEVLSVDGDAGVVRLRGPLGIRRTVRTRVTAARSPRLIIGVAELPSGTRARVSWTLAGRLGDTRVRLAAEIERAGAFDRLLLALGGRAWMRRRFRFGLDQLATTMRPLSQRRDAGSRPPTPSPPAPGYQSEGGSS